MEWAAKQTEFSDNFELPDLLDYNYFDPFGYNNDEQTTTVLDKLLTLQNKLTIHNPLTDKHSQQKLMYLKVIDLSIDAIKRGYGLTDKSVSLLNKIHAFTLDIYK